MNKYKLTLPEFIIMILFVVGMCSAFIKLSEHNKNKASTPTPTPTPIKEVVEDAPEPTKEFDTKPLLHAMHWRETQFSTIMDGEEGSLGPYQIRKLYWIDATEHRPEIGGRYEDCIGKEYSEKIIDSYWDRWAKGCEDYEVLARKHNKGPRGEKKQSSLQYWKDIKNFLDNNGKV